jgi:uncharacterized protein YbaR (Trm112 family)
MVCPRCKKELITEKTATIDTGFSFYGKHILVMVESARCYSCQSWYQTEVPIMEGTGYADKGDSLLEFLLHRLWQPIIGGR